MVIDCDIGNSPFSGGAVHIPPQTGYSKTRWLESWGFCIFPHGCNSYCPSVPHYRTSYSPSVQQLTGRAGSNGTRLLPGALDTEKLSSMMSRALRVSTCRGHRGPSLDTTPTSRQWRIQGGGGRGPWPLLSAWPTKCRPHRYTRC